MSMRTEIPFFESNGKSEITISYSTKGSILISIQKKTILVLIILGLLCVTISFAEEIRPKDDLRVSWLKKHAIPLRSIDPNDEDYTDLEPLAKVLGNVRIVQLGEQSHGDGATFHTKIRLIKFLHQRLGFDVLAFESGLYDCRKAWELLRGGMEPYEAFSHGVGIAWALSKQVTPLIEYWGKAAQSRQPLELCGFDCLHLGKAYPDLLLKDVNDLWDNLGDAAPSTAQRSIILNTLPKLDGSYKPRLQQRNQWHYALAAWRKALETTSPSDALTEADLAFWRQYVDSTSTLAASRGWSLDKLELKQRKTLRDPQMARNLAWLTRTVYPKRKIIVWAASTHLLRNFRPSWSKDEVNVPVNMGHHVWREFGEEAYTIAFTTAEGEFGYVGLPKARQLQPPAPDSLEDLFVRAGCINAFVDFRGLSSDGFWLKQKLIARPLGYRNMEANWTDMFDGIVFTKKMFRSTMRDND